MLTSVEIGDTTAYSTSWLMKEIHHQDNKHLDAVYKIRTETEEIGCSTGYLGYQDTPVCHKLSPIVKA